MLGAHRAPLLLPPGYHLPRSSGPAVHPRMDLRLLSHALSIPPGKGHVWETCWVQGQAVDSCLIPLVPLTDFPKLQA